MKRLRVGAIAAIVVMVGAVASAQPTPDPALPGAATGSGSGSSVGTTIDAPYIIGQPEVTASAAPSEVRVGEQFTLYVTAVYGSDVTVNLPATLGLGDVLEESPGRSAHDSKRADGKLIREWQVPLRAWTLGEIALPPVPVTFVAPGGAGQVMTGAVPIKIVATVADADDPTALRGMAAPRPLLRRDWFLVIVGAVVLGIIIVALIVWRLVKKARRRKARPRAVPRAAPVASQSLLHVLDGPSAEAMRALAKIAASGQVEAEPTGAIEQMVVVMRTYLGRRGGFSPADLTTSELEREVARRNAVSADLRPRMHRWLGVGDRVKYAGVPPDAAEAQITLDDARALVMEAAGVELTDEVPANG